MQIIRVPMTSIVNVVVRIGSKCDEVEMQSIRIERGRLVGLLFSSVLEGLLLFKCVGKLVLVQVYVGSWNA